MLTAAPPRKRVRVSYNHALQILAVIALTTGAEEKRLSINLSNVTFLKEAGRREGCADSGMLGFIEGDIDDEQPTAEGHPICWARERWEDGRGREVFRASHVSIHRHRVRAHDHC